MMLDLRRLNNFNVEGGHYVEVRSGPGKGYPVVGRFYDTKKQSIYLCDSDGSDTWQGIVYKSGPAEQCKVNKPRPEERSYYQGPCAQGWIQATDVREISE